jgi:hypothetical protein
VEVSSPVSQVSKYPVIQGPEFREVQKVREVEKFREVEKSRRDPKVHGPESPESRSPGKFKEEQVTIQGKRTEMRGQCKKQKAKAKQKGYFLVIVFCFEVFLCFSSFPVGRGKKAEEAKEKTRTKQNKTRTKQEQNKNKTRTKQEQNKNEKVIFLCFSSFPLVRERRREKKQKQKGKGKQAETNGESNQQDTEKDHRKAQK